MTVWKPSTEGDRASEVGPSLRGSRVCFRCRRPARPSPAIGRECRTRAEIAGRAVLIEVLDPGSPCCSLGCVFGIDPVLESRRTDFHAKASASRITSEQDLPSRSARASRALISSWVRRRAITCDGAAPRPGRPRPHFFKPATSCPVSVAQSKICPSVIGVPLIISRSLMPLMHTKMAEWCRAENRKEVAMVEYDFDVAVTSASEG